MKGGVYRMLTDGVCQGVYEFGLPGGLCPYSGHLQATDTGNGLSFSDG